MTARWLVRCLLMLWLCGPWPAAQAHKPSDSYLALDVAGTQVNGQWDIALRDLDFAIGLDQDGDGKLTWDEIRARHAAIAAYALDHLTLATAHGPCTVQAGGQLIDHHTDGAYSVLRFADNPAVTGEPRVIFYAGAPLLEPSGHAIGTLCLIDHEPRSLDATELAILASLRDLLQEELSGGDDHA